MKLRLIAICLVACAGGISGERTEQAMQQVPVLPTLQEPAENWMTNSRAEEHDIFRDVTPLLLQKTRVPLRLPSFIPYSGNKEWPIYAIVESVDQSGYEIQLAWTKDCNGGNYCHYGTVRGSAKPLVENTGVRVPIKLLGDIRGYFVDFTCGAHCDDSSVGWSEGSYHYSISIKAEKMSVLVKIANSALPHSKKTSVQEPSFIFQQVAPKLRLDSRVPLRLPGYLPLVDEEHPIYAIIQSASSSNYDILLAAEEPCEGQNFCTYGSVRGSVSPLDVGEGKHVSVMLRGGRKGQFIDAVCYAYCNQSYVAWTENGFHYAIGIKAEKMETLVKVANSALASGRSEKR